MESINFTTFVILVTYITSEIISPPVLTSSFTTAKMKEKKNLAKYMVNSCFFRCHRYFRKFSAQHRILKTCGMKYEENMLLYAKMFTEALPQQLTLRNFHEASRRFRTKETEHVMMHCNTSTRLGYGLENRGIVFRFPTGAIYFSLPQNVQTGCGANQTPHALR